MSETLGALGARHAGYGVTAPMYDVVGEALISTLATVCNDVWSTDLEHAWRDAYRAIRGLMLAGVAVAA